MFRLFENKLNDWKISGMDKPLMVIGVRQIGKTYTIEKFAKANFKEYIYINLEKEEYIREIFERTINEEKVFEEIELYLGRKIDIDNTIIFFDEVHVSERFIVSLKYFCESKKAYKIVCAGSLLGVKINRFNDSFPVGKIKMEHMYPMNFQEFLIAIKKDMLLEKIKECYNNMEAMPNFAHEEALNLYRRYLCVGGMPESVNNFIQNELDILKYDSKILSTITEMYISDMSKYVKNSIETVKIEKIYTNIPAQLAKDKKAFKYNYIEEGARKRSYEHPIEWLVSAGMILSSSKIKKAEIPLKVYIDDEKFKLFFSDVRIIGINNRIKV